MTCRIALFVACMLAAAALASCGKTPGTNSAGAAPADTAPNAAGAASAASKAELPRPVRTLRVGMSEVGDLLILPGEVRPRYEQRYGFRIGGKIAQRLVDVGQEVKAGQVLALLDSQDVMPAINTQTAQLEAARSDLKLQQSELKRVQELREKGFVSSAALERQTTAAEAAQARLQAAQAQLASAQNGLLFQTLRADKAGVVVAVDADAGSVVASGQSVVRVAQQGEREIAINVPERTVALMKKARGFDVRVEALADRAYAAKLRELSPVADAASRTYAARLAIVAADESLKLGMSATVRLDLGTAQAIVVPNSALYTRDNKTRVWLVEPSSATVNPVVVELGESTGDGVVILAGLKPGDLVVTAGANLLLPGQKVLLPDASAQRAGKS